MASQYPPDSTSRLVTKLDTAGNLILPNLNGLTITTGTSGAYGVWALAVSSTSAEYYVTGISVIGSGANNIDGPVFAEIGTGGSGSETTMGAVIVTGQTASGTGLPRIAGLTQFAVPLRFSAGTRLSVRAAMWSTTSAQTYQAWLHAVPFSSVEGN